MYFFQKKTFYSKTLGGRAFRSTTLSKTAIHALNTISCTANIMNYELLDNTKQNSPIQTLTSITCAAKNYEL